MLLLAAFFVVYIGWGSTFLAARTIVLTIPPLLVTAVRSGIAGIILLLVATRNQPQLPRQGWGHAAIAGSLFFLGGHGLLMSGLTQVPSGIAAVIEAAVPAWILLFARLAGIATVGARQLAGIVVGMTGIALLSAPWEVGASAPISPTGSVEILVSGAAWGAGTVYLRRFRTALPANVTAAQALLCGALASMAVSGLLGEWNQVARTDWTPTVAAAMAYLIVVGSLLGFAAYNWLLGEVGPVTAGTYAFVNPVVAVLIGWWWAGEELTARVAIATAITLSGLYLLLVERRPLPPAPFHSPTQEAIES